MGLLRNIFQGFSSPKNEIKEDTFLAFKPVDTPQASVYDPYRYNNLHIFGGEKTPFELGTPVGIDLDYNSLRFRAWEAYLKTDIVQNAIRKYCLWVAGSGLKLQSDPVKSILGNSGINISDEQIKDFTSIVEAKFRSFAKSRHSGYSGNISDSVQAMSSEALKNALIAGDCLCISRFDGKKPTLQVIDGGSVCNPIGSDFFKEAENRGNYIYKGVELNKKGTHIAYYVREEAFVYKRVLARASKSGRLQAWLMYGLKAKLTDVRGMSLLTAVMETVAKMDRYKEAKLGSAEENAKIVYSIEHGSNSDGETPLERNIAQSFGEDKGVAPETVPSDGSEVATKIAQTTGKQTFNLTQDSKLVAHKGTDDVTFGEFWQPNIEVVYATLGIPPEVAADKFGGAYSGSRAALKSWEYKMMVDREIILKWHFYDPFYIYWLDLQILQNKIQAPGYLQALLDKNYEVLDAYRNTRFIGAGVPHIDPVKEVNSERLKLGTNLKSFPLTTVEQSMEILGTGDPDAMINKIQNEYEQAKQFIEDTTIVSNSNSSFSK